MFKFSAYIDWHGTPYYLFENVRCVWSISPIWVKVVSHETKHHSPRTMLTSNLGLLICAVSSIRSNVMETR